MTSTVNMQKSGLSFNKIVGIGVAAYAVIEAIVAYFFVFAPMYIKPVYQMCADYNSNGTTCIVTLFGKMFATKAEVANNQIILSLWDTIFNMILIYLVTTGVTLLLAFCIYKGMSFAKGYFIAFFGAKHIAGMMTVVIPFANVSKSTSIFGIVVAVISLALCIFFIKLNNEEYAEDMVFTPEQTAQMKKRMNEGFALYFMFMLIIVLLRVVMPALGSYWSLYLGWLGNTSMGQGWALAVLLAVALVAAIMYIREGEWAMYFYCSFGTAVAVCALMALIFRILWVFKTYNPTKALANEGDVAAIEWVRANGMTTSWWVATILIVIMFVAAAAVAFLAFTKIRRKISFKFTPDEKKPAFAILISAGSIVLSFVLTIVAVTIWHKMMYPGASVGAMDYMYFIIYGGATLFLALAMMGGYGFTKFGTLGLYLLVASNNFISIFSVFSQRSAAVAAGTVTTGTNYIIAGILFILSLISCLAIILVFVVKGVSDYQYQKRFC